MPSGARSRPTTTCRGARRGCASTRTNWCARQPVARRRPSAQAGRRRSHARRRQLVVATTPCIPPFPSSADHADRCWAGLVLALFTVQSHALVGLLPPSKDAPCMRRAVRSRCCCWRRAAGIVLPPRPTGAGLAIRCAVAHLLVVARGHRAAGVHGGCRAVCLGPCAGLDAGARHPVAGPAIDLGIVIGVAGTLLAFALFVCTGMVYACVRFLAEWHTPLTLLNYTLLGGASGFMLAAGLATLAAPSLVGFLSGWAIVLTLLAAIGRLASLWRNARLRPRSTIQSAIGIKHPVVVQRSKGFMGGSFNTREFFHGVAAPRLRLVKHVFLMLAFVVPWCWPQQTCRGLRVATAGRVRGAVRRPAGGALVLLRAGQSPAEPVLPGGVVMRARAAGWACCCCCWRSRRRLPAVQWPRRRGGCGPRRCSPPVS